MKIKWRAHFPTSGMSAEKVYDVLSGIQKKQGFISPESVIEKAKVKTSPLHKGFEWDDTAAAHQHRMTQARNIIQAIKIIKLEVSPQPIRAFELRGSTKPESIKPRKVYDNIEDILADPVTRNELLDRALAELRAFEKRYSHLRELNDTFKAMRRIRGFNKPGVLRVTG